MNNRFLNLILQKEAIGNALQRLIKPKRMTFLKGKSMISRTGRIMLKPLRKPR
jgi:hypothetical protein